jgi:hypothetical protein
MTLTELPVSPMTDGVRSLEIRWILPGSIDARVAGWFGRRFLSTEESREDLYLMEPQLGGLSVKVRAGAALEVKMYGGSPGMLTVAGRTTGRIESWQKWSFPFSQYRRGRGDQFAWQPVRKKRHVSRLTRREGDRAATAGPSPGLQPKCEVDLAEIHANGQAWWTLGFEATGPLDLLRGELQATADLVFAHRPSGLELGVRESRSYAQWLSERHSAEARSVPLGCSLADLHGHRPR